VSKILSSPNVFPWRVFVRTIVVQMGLLLAAIGLSGFLARSFFKSESVKQIQTELRGALEIASHSLTPETSEKWCIFSSSGTHFRVTLLKDDGSVVCDSHHDASTMENHADRPEISDAIGLAEGSSLRHSETERSNMLYLARTSPDEQFILRFAVSLKELDSTLADFDRAILIALIVIAIILSVGEIWFAHVFVSPLRSLLHRAEVGLRTQETALTAKDLGRASWGEWEHLDGVIESLRRDVKQKMDTLRDERNHQNVIMNSISDAILVIDGKNTISYYNENIVTLFPHLTMQKSQNLLEVCREPLVLDSFQAAIQKGQRDQVQSLKLETTQGIRYFALSVSPIVRDDNKPHAAVGVFHDITDLKMAEQMRIDFVANVSHEMRTPLASIKGYANTALEDVRANMPVTEDVLLPIVRNSDRMVRIVSDLLDISSLDSGTQLQLETLECKAHSNRMAALFQNTLAERNQTLRVVAKEERVTADPIRLEQVLSNLIDNASKYSPSGSQIQIQWNETENATTLEVRDNGPGIEKQHLHRLFERFYRVDKGRSRNLGGTGLGLAIVKHIMMAHGGTVSVESEIGAGTVFRCVFPKKSCC
jgi:two-component system phosphate regulon sensor histidine kinase PhoR